MKPRSLTPLWWIPRSSRRSTAWWNVACDTEIATWWTQPGSVGVRSGSGTRSSLVKIVIRRPSPGSKYRWDSDALSRFGCSNTNGIPSRPSQKSIEVWRSAPTIVMWWTPWLCSLRIGPSALAGLVGDCLLRLVGHPEADRILLLLGQVREQARRAGQDRDRLHDRGGEAELQQHGGHRHRDVHRQRLAPGLVHGVADAAGELDVGPADAALVGQLQDALRARVGGLVHRVAEAREAAARLVCLSRDLPRRLPALGAAVHPPLRLLEQRGALLRGAEQHRAAAQDPRRDRALQR